MLEEEVLATAFKKELLSRKWRANRSGSIRIPKHRISLPVSKNIFEKHQQRYLKL